MAKVSPEVTHLLRCLNFIAKQCWRTPKRLLSSGYVTVLVNDRDAYPAHVADGENKKQGIITVGQRQKLSGMHLPYCYLRSSRYVDVNISDNRVVLHGHGDCDSEVRASLSSVSLALPS